MAADERCDADKDRLEGGPDAGALGAALLDDADLVTACADCFVPLPFTVMKPASTASTSYVCHFSLVHFQRLPHRLHLRKRPAVPAPYLEVFLLSSSP